jgi:hypothetical protein
MNPLERVAAWAEEAEPVRTPGASSNGFDLRGFIARHEQLQVRKEKSLPDGTVLYELQTCPFNADHKKGSAFITQAPDGKVGFKCHHNSCAEKGWKELRAFLEPDYHPGFRAGSRAQINGVNAAPTPPANEEEACEPPHSSSHSGRSASQSLASDRAEFRLTSLAGLFAEPDEHITWILDGILPAEGLSLMLGKPKAGKSTFARCLALAVAQGEPFLNRATVKGAVLYLALEEKRSEVKKHFRALGARGDEAILIHADRAPVNALTAAKRVIEQHRPVLVIIDPLLKFARVRDANDYAQVSEALEPLLELARKSRAHVLLVYHAGKGEKSDAVDSACGTTAFGAAVDTILVLKRTERYRTLQTVQRYGADLSETVLDFDSGRRAVILGAEKSMADSQRIAEGILDYLGGISGRAKEADINEAVEGSTKLQRTALRDLVEAGKVLREGSGRRGDPYLYSTAGQSSFSCSQDISGTRKQESEKVAYSAETKAEILIPANSAKSTESADGREQEFQQSEQVEPEL